MNIKHLRAVLVIALVVVFLAVVGWLGFSGNRVYAAAADTEVTTEETTDEEQSEEPTTPAEPEETTPAVNDTQAISDSVKEYLKAIYGDDYEKHYNAIVENWGSVEKFLLNASDNLPEEYKYKATELITTVNAYIGVAADAVLLICVGAYIIYRAKKNKKLSSDLSTLKAGDNQIEEAQLAIMESQKAQSKALQALLPGDKFAEQTAALADSDKVIDKATEEVKRIV